MPTEIVKIEIENYNDLILRSEKYALLINTITQSIEPCSYKKDKITLDEDQVLAVFKLLVPYVYDSKVKEFAPKEEPEKE